MPLKAIVDGQLDIFAPFQYLQVVQTGNNEAAGNEYKDDGEAHPFIEKFFNQMVADINYVYVHVLQ